MNKYFALQSWLALAACFIIAWRVAPVIGGVAILVGAFVSGIIWCGLSSWRYNQISQESYREEWANRYWSVMVYKEEVIAQIFATAFFFGLAFLSGWSLFWFLTGGGIISSLNVIVRGVWANVFHYV